MNVNISKRIQESIDTKNNLLLDTNVIQDIERVASLCVKAFQQGNKVLFAGNGGSAADAQHLAAELSGRYAYDRPPLYAEALHVNTSYLTAVANDYSYDITYSRLITAMGKQGDLLFAFSTSGNSPNILSAASEAQSKGMTVIGMTGKTGGNLLKYCDYCFKVPSASTPRIQECHILIGHIICEIIETELFPK